MRISDQELEHRKKEIIHQAFQLFCKRGIDNVTMEEIARASRVSAMSVYRYFSTKAEVVLHTQQVLWNEISQKIIDNTRQNEELYCMKSGYEQAKTVLKGFENLYRDYSHYILFAADFKLYLFREKLQIKEKDHMEMLDSVQILFYHAIEKGREDGSIQVKGDIEDIFYTMWGILRGFVELIAIYDNIMDGENQWKERYPYVMAMMLEFLKTNRGTNIFDGTEH